MKSTKFIPTWVKVAVALALGLGTMVGWKRIVVTVGEKIGKEHLTYAQGAAAEIVAMCTIMAADQFGLPVSTTHVLSSGVAGTMVANRSGLQWIDDPEHCAGVGLHTADGGAAVGRPVLSAAPHADEGIAGRARRRKRNLLGGAVHWGRFSGGGSSEATPGDPPYFLWGGAQAALIYLRVSPVGCEHPGAMMGSDIQRELSAEKHS